MPPRGVPEAFRKHVWTRRRDFEALRPAYEYGSRYAGDARYKGWTWDQVETDLRSGYERDYPGSRWERVKSAVRQWLGAGDRSEIMDLPERKLPEGQDQTVPVIEEELVTGTRTVKTGSVRIHKQVEEVLKTVEMPTFQDVVEVDAGTDEPGGYSCSRHPRGGRPDDYFGGGGRDRSAQAAGV